MSAKITQVVQKNGAVPAATPLAPASPSQSERDERILSTAKVAFDLLNSAANSCDLKRAEDAFALARDQIEAACPGGVDELVDRMHRILMQASEPATRADVAKAALSLIGSFPNTSKADLKLFSLALGEDIAATEPSRMALAMMVRSVRRTAVFMPAIPEVLAALEAAERKIEQGWSTVFLLAGRWDDARRQVEKLAVARRNWMAEQISDYRQQAIRGEDVRGFLPEVRAAANPTAAAHDAQF